MPDNPNKREMTRRQALKTLGVGAGVIATLPVLGGIVRADDDSAVSHAHMHGAVPAQEPSEKPYKLKFFSEAENRTVIEMSERIIPADDRSPGAKAAKVNEYADFMLSLSPPLVQHFWHDGLAAVELKSQSMLGKSFADASEDDQVKVLKEIDKNEARPQTIEQQFFRAIKEITIDGYYTSSVGIHKELHYKGNSYNKEFPGCTHPEHQVL